MVRKNSIFMKLLVPVISVMFLQSLLIGAVLYLNGTIQSLKTSAIDTLSTNAMNRSNTLENSMVHNWAGLDNLEEQILDYLNEYTKQNQVRMEDALQDPLQTNAMLNQLSASVLSTLRSNSSTGVYLYFYGEDPGAEEVSLPGIYYRDMDPISSTLNNSDLLCLKGPVSIARRHNITLDSLWTEKFRFSSRYPVQWQGYTAPMQAAAQYPTLNSQDLSFWNQPHVINPNSHNDLNECLTYTRPIVWNGKPIGAIGTEIDARHLGTYFPASDFGNSGQGGYLLLNYDSSLSDKEQITCRIYTATGSYINRLLGNNLDIKLEKEDGEGIYSLSSSQFEPVHLALKPLNLYNANAPFSNEQWALASINTDQSLFEPARRIQTGLLISFFAAFMIGTVLLAFVIRRLMTPLSQIVKQLEESEPDDPINIPKQDIYEITTLSHTLNEMKQRRKGMDVALREERERYLIALESATDIFMEYDIKADILMVYVFAQDAKHSRLQTRSLCNYSDIVGIGEFGHPDDKETILALLNAQPVKTPVEIRVQKTYFPRITDIESDNGYYWFALRYKYIYDEDGTAKKVIGNAREVTEEKQREAQLLETSRRDALTGLYNREYGLARIERCVAMAVGEQKPCTLFYIRANHLDLLEAHYGRVFSEIIIREFSGNLKKTFSEDALFVRVWNDEFLVFLPESNGQELGDLTNQLMDSLARQYMGEDPELCLTVSIGAAVLSDEADGDELIDKAGLAMQYAAQKREASCYYRNLRPEEKAGVFQPSQRPVSNALNISSETIVSVVFEVFEHTSDIRSAIKAIIGLLGDVFSLSRVLVCSFDNDFGVNTISYQWHHADCLAYPKKVERISQEALEELGAMLSDTGTVLYEGRSAVSLSEDITRLLCMTQRDSVDTFCCVTYENGLQTGRVLFQTDREDYSWNKSDTYSMQEVSKIIAAHVSIERSNNASKAKSEFLSRVSHEIRTPMNVIIGMATIAKDVIEDPQQVGGCIEKIEFAAGHLLSLINDVLEMSRIESGKMVLEINPFSLTHLLEGLDILMRPAIDANDIEFIIRQDICQEYVLGDEQRIRQVLINFLGNANKFTQPGGKITLSIEEQNRDSDASWYHFSVTDTGVGIRPEEQRKVFVAFEQAGESINRKTGTGLGLSISSNIISAMNSKIELESEPGVGSTFSFTLRLPYAAVDQADAVGEKTEAASDQEEVDYEQQLSGKRVLLVEDIEINMEIAKYILEGVGMEVDNAWNGQEAVEKFLQSEPGTYDIILMDIQMPVMDGLAATRAIRKNTSRSDARTVPIVAMTANAFDEDMNHALESGMNGHATKPIDTEQLYSLIASLISE